MIPIDPLAESVQQMAENPSPEAEEAFCRALLNSRVGARLPQSYSGTTEGEYTIADDDEIGFPITSDPEGNPMLVAYCDIEGMSQQSPDEGFFTVEGRAVLELARESGFGIIVNCVTGEHPCYAGIRQEEIARILDRECG